MESAEKAVKLGPMWSVAWRTLARAQVGIGEIEMVQFEMLDVRFLYPVILAFIIIMYRDWLVFRDPYIWILPMPRSV